LSWKKGTNKKLRRMGSRKQKTQS